MRFRVAVPTEGFQTDLLVCSDPLCRRHVQPWSPSGANWIHRSDGNAGRREVIALACEASSKNHLDSSMGLGKVIYSRVIDKVCIERTSPNADMRRTNCWMIRDEIDILLVDVTYCVRFIQAFSKIKSQGQHIEARKHIAQHVCTFKVDQDRYVEDLNGCGRTVWIPYSTL